LAASYVGKVPVRIVAAPRELATFTYSLVWHNASTHRSRTCGFGSAFDCWLAT
jgi:hypothetical protein